MQNSQDSNCASDSFLIKLQALGSGGCLLVSSKLISIDYKILVKVIRTSHWRCSLEKESQEKHLCRDLFNETLDFSQKCFYVLFLKILRTPLLQNTSKRLLLFQDCLFYIADDSENVGSKSKSEKAQVFPCAVEKICQRKLLKVSLETLVINGIRLIERT